jgi:acetyl-CoA C-acetyltransferase
VGATGIAQIYEIVRQLRGEAINQVRDAQIGLAQNLGGTGAVSTVHILKRR